MLQVLNINVLLVSLNEEPRSFDPTVGSHRIISEKLSNFIGFDGNSSEVIGILTTGFRQKKDRMSESVGMTRILSEPLKIRYPELLVGILSLGFRQLPTNSRRIR
jgi:hypothetical protein